MASSDTAHLLENTGSMGRSARNPHSFDCRPTWSTVKQYFFGVFPYIGEMLVSVGVKEAEIGFYAGTWEDCKEVSCSLGWNILSLDQAWWKPPFQQQNVSFCSSFGQAYLRELAEDLSCSSVWQASAPVQSFMVYLKAHGR